MYKRKSGAPVPRQRIITASSSSPDDNDDTGSGHEIKLDTKAFDTYHIDMAVDEEPEQKSKIQIQQQQQQPHSQQRSVGSLVLLTQKFVDLMKQNGGSIDLKEVDNVHFTIASLNLYVYIL